MANGGSEQMAGATGAVAWGSATAAAEAGMRRWLRLGSCARQVSVAVQGSEGGGMI